MFTRTTPGREQYERTTAGANENQTLSSRNLVPWSDMKVTETINGLSPEAEQQRRIRRLQEISSREKLAVHPPKLNLSRSLCKNCQSVPWDQLASSQLPGPAGVRVLFEIHETRETLARSACIVCKYISSIWPEGVKLERCFLGVRCLCNMLPGQATSSHHSPGYDHSPQFQLSGYVQKTQVWCSENFGVLHPWSSHDELAPRHVDVDRINIQLVREWLQICKTSHKHDLSGPRGKECVPGFKVIDCRTKRIIPVRHDVCQYVALSYVWGEAATEDHKAGQYPKTIEDSIAVCNMLGFEYIWVDRYCINQKDKAEKGVQIKMMDCIYSQAQLTIVATDPDPSKGLSGVGPRARNKQQSLRLGNIELIKTYHTDEAILRSTWATRGWTFQEGYLSRRKLIFTENEVVYVCDDMYCQESIRRDIPTRTTGQRQGLAGAAMEGICPMSTSERKGQVKLDDLLNEYNSRDLRYQSDTLDACQGILRGLSIPHNWGLPIIPTSWWEAGRRPPTSHGMNLYWQSDEPGVRRPDFPSWSWVGWQGQKIFHNYDHYYTDASVIEAKSTAGKWLNLEQCFNPRDGSLQTALSKRIRITGSMVELAPYVVNQAWIKNRMPGYQPSHKGPHAVFPYSANIDIVATVHLDGKDASTDVLKDTIAVLINRHQKRRYRGIMLVLKPDGDHYKRVGILNFRNIGVHKDRRDFTESKSLIKGENGCFWMKDFRQKAVEVE